MPLLCATFARLCAMASSQSSSSASSVAGGFGAGGGGSANAGGANGAGGGGSSGGGGKLPSKEDALLEAAADEDLLVEDSALFVCLRTMHGVLQAVVSRERLRLVRRKWVDETRRCATTSSSSGSFRGARALGVWHLSRLCDTWVCVLAANHALADVPPAVLDLALQFVQFGFSPAVRQAAAGLLGLLSSHYTHLGYVTSMLLQRFEAIKKDQDLREFASVQQVRPINSSRHDCAELT